MADADLSIALTGINEAIAGLDKLRVAGEGAFKGIANAANQSVAGGAGLGGAALERDLNRGTDAANRFREAIHILHPILETAGLGMGNLGSFARLAGAGIGALAGTAIAAAIIGLENLSDRTAIAQKSLKDLGASSADIAKLGDVSASTGVALGQLAKNYEAFIKVSGQSGTIRFVRPPGSTSPGQGTNAFETLNQLFTLGAGTTAGGQDQLNKFLGALGPQGQITGATANALDPGSAQQLLQLFHIPFRQGETPQRGLWHTVLDQEVDLSLPCSQPCSSKEDV